MSVSCHSVTIQVYVNCGCLSVYLCACVHAYLCECVSEYACTVCVAVCVQWLITPPTTTQEVLIAKSIHPLQSIHVAISSNAETERWQIVRLILLFFLYESNWYVLLHNVLILRFLLDRGSLALSFYIPYFCQLISQPNSGTIYSLWTGNLILPTTVIFGSDLIYSFYSIYPTNVLIDASFCR